MGNHSETVIYLLDKGADVNLMDRVIMNLHFLNSSYCYMFIIWSFFNYSFLLGR